MTNTAIDKVTTSALKKYVASRDNSICQYCGAETKNGHVDHVVPRLIGGPSLAYNLVYSCCPCNVRKAGETWIPKNLEKITSENIEWRAKIISLAVDAPYWIKNEPGDRKLKQAGKKQTPLEAKRSLIDSGGRIMQYRIKPEINLVIMQLMATGEFRTVTNAISAALIEAAKRRKL